jgi:FkbM family methyltransferase
MPHMKYLVNWLPLTRLKLLIARGLFCLVKPIYGAEKRIVRRGGLNYEIDISEGLDLSLFLFGNFQKHVSENKFVDFPLDAVIFDVGANVGIMSLQFASKVPKGIVYAFEPTHYALAKLKKNLWLNREVASRIQVIHTFVSSKENNHQEIRAFSSWKINKAPGVGQHPVHGGTAMSSEGVPTITIDDFVTSRGIERLDFIKIDTDGHEFDVLLGAKNTIERFRPQIIFELGQYVMEERGIDFKDYNSFFDRLGYSLTDAADNKPITLSNYCSRIPREGTIDVLAKVVV